MPQPLAPPKRNFPCARKHTHSNQEQLADCDRRLASRQALRREAVAAGEPRPPSTAAEKAVRKL